MQQINFIKNILCAPLPSIHSDKVNPSEILQMHLTTNFLKHSICLSLIYLSRSDYQYVQQKH